MTTFEHAMLGVTQTLATGLHRRYGWQLAAMAGFVAISPDWDGLTIAGGMQLFDVAHRAWGHSLLVCTILGMLLAGLDYRFDLVTRAGGYLRRLMRDGSKTDGPRSQRRWNGYCVWMMVGAVVALTHLIADMVVSGAAQLNDWALQLLWPFSREGFVYPLVSWGDPGMSIVFVLGMFGMWRWPKHLQLVAGTTLLLLVAYIMLRGAMR
jgi:membrane-bound metal-dependent hydrolase YbcI (DUF457 family)